jgi:hypothetical protein
MRLVQRLFALELPHFTYALQHNLTTDCFAAAATVIGSTTASSSSVLETGHTHTELSPVRRVTIQKLIKEGDHVSLCKSDVSLCPLPAAVEIVCLISYRRPEPVRVVWCVLLHRTC